MKSHSLTIAACLMVFVLAVPASAETTSGQIGALGAVSFQLTTGQSFNVSSATAVTLNGTKSAYANLEVGYAVSVEYAKCLSKTGFPCASAIVATSPTKTEAPATATSTGTIGSVSLHTFALTTGQSFEVSSTTGVMLNGVKSAYGNLAAGMSATVEHTKCLSKSGLPCAKNIVALGKVAPTTQSLMIYSVSKSGVIPVDTAGAQSSGIADAATIITLNGAKAGLLYLKPGMACNVVRRATNPSIFDRIDAVTPTK